MNLLLSGMTADKLPQVLAVFTATLSVISDGMHYSWAAPLIPILQGPDSPLPISEDDVMWLEALYMIGGVVGLPITTYFVDKFGRKKSILLASCAILISWLLTAFVRSLPVLYVARLITGMGSDMAFVSTPMYIAEIADQSIRGFLGSLVFIMMVVGVVIIYSVGPFVSIMTSSLVGAAINLLQLVTFPFMPESPYFLLMKGKTEEAKKSLARLRNTQDVDEEFKDIAHAVDRQLHEKHSMLDLFKIKSNLKGVTIMVVLNTAQEFGGITVILMNLHTILEDGEAILSPSTAGILFAVLMLVAGSAAGITVDKLGRKVLLASSCVLTGISLAVLATYFALKNSGVDVSPYNWIPVASVMMFAIVFKLGLGLIPIVLTGELFSTSVKAKGMAIADSMYVIFGALSIIFYQLMVSAYGIHAPFFFFAACCFLVAVYTIVWIPETKGKSLEEIQILLKGNKIVREQLEMSNSGEIRKQEGLSGRF